MSAVVKIKCGSVFGSGFVRIINGKKYAVTAAHVIINAIDLGESTCSVIFPWKRTGYNFYEEAHYRIGTILDTEITKENYKEKGFDMALLEILPIREEDERVFPNGQPNISEPFCSETNYEEPIILWGYASHVGTAATPGGILSRFPGIIRAYALTSGTNQSPDAGAVDGYSYLPNLNNVSPAGPHSHVVISSENNFSGASGGLVFNILRRCIVGINIATGVEAREVLGLIVNLNFDAIRTFLETR